VSVARLACFVRELAFEAGVKPLKVGLRIRLLSVVGSIVETEPLSGNIECYHIATNLGRERHKIGVPRSR
jgi:hypothetical protein